MVEVTQHARQRFAKLKCKRRRTSKECNLSDKCTNLKVANVSCRFLRRDIDREILGLFEQAEKEEYSEGLVNRIIANNFQETKYYKKDNIRFVVLVKEQKILTIERNDYTRSYSERGFIRKQELGDRIKK